LATYGGGPGIDHDRLPARPGPATVLTDVVCRVHALDNVTRDVVPALAAAAACTDNDR